MLWEAGSLVVLVFHWQSQHHLHIPIPGAYLGLKLEDSAMMYSPVLHVMQQLGSK